MQVIDTAYTLDNIFPQCLSQLKPKGGFHGTLGTPPGSATATSRHFDNTISQVKVKWFFYFIEINIVITNLAFKSDPW